MSAFEIRRRRAEDLHGSLERRGVASPTLDITDERDGIMVGGYASLSGVAYEVGDPAHGGFIETICAGAFKRTLSENCDVVLNALHGAGLSGLPLARTKSGTLSLLEDQRGLKWSASLEPSDPDVQTLLPKLRRGDLDGASFAFRVTDDEWDSEYRNRLVKSITMTKGDISIVPFGANPGADTKLLSAATRSRVVIPDYSAREREQLAKYRRAS